MIATSVATKVVVRPYATSDRHAVRAIACSTAFRNRGHEVVFPDAELFADYWTRYYTDNEPASCLIAERDGVVVGYLLGCLDTQRFRRVMATRILPRVAGLLSLRSVRGEYPRDGKLGRLVRWMLTRSWREEPAIDTAQFPAHYHLNLLSAVRGERLYSTMALQFTERVSQRGIGGIHGQVLDYRDTGVWPRMVQAFQRACPEATVTTTMAETSMGRVLWDDSLPMCNFAFASSTADYVKFLQWLRQWRRL